MADDRGSGEQISECQVLPFLVTKNMLKKLPKLPGHPSYSSNVTRPPQLIVSTGAPKKSKNKKGKRMVLIWRYQEGYIPVDIRNYELFVFIQGTTGNETPPFMWLKVEDIQALNLPAATFLKGFVRGYKYYFVLRGITKDEVAGNFSYPVAFNIL